MIIEICREMKEIFFFFFLQGGGWREEMAGERRWIDQLGGFDEIR